MKQDVSAQTFTESADYPFTCRTLHAALHHKRELRFLRPLLSYVGFFFPDIFSTVVATTRLLPILEFHGWFLVTVSNASGQWL
ncbi:hypothetical protein SORBI_3008G065050 [Sorghum bicolor]|uniref:Uncharacterized protein n=1 Tax=Sorghum bicolor TaxID=4558 RepID=A0A1Z5R5N0_SORBI|nr:hypothetical protein SORBI_3008G065050 [Sorghum bicolor]